MINNLWIKEPDSWPKICIHPEHYPPQHIVYPPGKHSHKCPSCGRSVEFTIPIKTWC